METNQKYEEQDIEVNYLRRTVGITRMGKIRNEQYEKYVLLVQPILEFVEMRSITGTANTRIQHTSIER